MGILSVLFTIALATNGVSCINENSTQVSGQMRMIQPNIIFNKRWCASVKSQCYIDRKSRALCRTENSSQCGPCGFPAGKSVTYSSLESDLTCHNPMTPWVYHNQPGGIILFSFLGDINQAEPRWNMCMHPSHNKLSLPDLLQSPCVGSNCGKQSVNFRICVLDSPSREITSDCFSKHTLLGFPGNKGVVQLYIEGTLSCEHCLIEASINELAIGCFPVVIKPSSSQPIRIQRRSILSANETAPEGDKTNATDESSAAPIVRLTDSKVLKTDEGIIVTDSKVLKTDEVVSIPDSKRFETIGVNHTQELFSPDLLPQDASKQPNSSSNSHHRTDNPRTTPVNLITTAEILKLNASEILGETTISLNSSVSFNESISINGSAFIEDIVDSRVDSNNNKVINHNDTDQKEASNNDESEPVGRTSFAKVVDNISKALPGNKKPTSDLVQRAPGITTESHVSSVHTMSFEEEWNMHEKEAEKHEMDIQANLGKSSYGTTEPDPAPEPDPFLPLNDMTDPPMKSPAQTPDAIVMWSYSVLGVLVAFSAK